MDRPGISQIHCRLSSGCSREEAMVVCVCMRNRCPTDIKLFLKYLLSTPHCFIPVQKILAAACTLLRLFYGFGDLQWGPPVTELFSRRSLFRATFKYSTYLYCFFVGFIFKRSSTWIQNFSKIQKCFLFPHKVKIRKDRRFQQSLWQAMFAFDPVVH